MASLDGPKLAVRRRDSRRGHPARAYLPRRERQTYSPARLVIVVGLALTGLHILHSGSLPLVSHTQATSRSADLAELLNLHGEIDPVVSVPLKKHDAAEATPKLIPRIIHQTYKNRDLPPAAKQYMRTWHTMNPGWEVRFYDDEACLEFVRSEFPEYLVAYKALERDVERSDFFRYMVVLRHGGVYADIDTEVRQPLDSILQPFDTLVVGWESDFISAEAAVDAAYVRPRQILQWVFAGAPGHPALRSVCDRVVSQATRRFSLDPSIDTLERTGPGVFTDAVLAVAREVPWSRASHDPWRVRILPRVAFGAPRTPKRGLTPRDPGVVVQHHFLGSWRSRRRWPWQRSPRELFRSITARFIARPGEASTREIARVSAMPDAFPETLYPTSVAFDPPFVAMAPRGGLGDPQSGGADVAAAIAAHGSWQPSVQPLRGPTLMDVVIGSMGRSRRGEDGASLHNAGVFVDIGAGYGLLTLAAAARGHRVHAFELGKRSRDGLEAALRYNAFEGKVIIHDVALGGIADNGTVVCLGDDEDYGMSSLDMASLNAGKAYRGMYASRKERLFRGSSNGREKSDDTGGLQQHTRLTAEEVEVSRGYGPLERYGPQQNGVLVAKMKPSSDYDAMSPSHVGVIPSSSGCRGPSAMRLTLADALSLATSDSRIDALRVSANGWEPRILEGAKPLLVGAQPPPVVAVEWNPAAMHAAGTEDPVTTVLALLHDAGYTEASHSGYICDERWYAATYGVRRRGGVAPEELAALRQPTWCRLEPSDWPLLMERSSRPGPETLLFINREAGLKRLKQRHGVEEEERTTTSTLLVEEGEAVKGVTKDDVKVDETAAVVADLADEQQQNLGHSMSIW